MLIKTVNIIVSVPNPEDCGALSENRTDDWVQSGFLELLEWTRSQRVRTGWTTRDYSPRAWTSCTSQLEIIHIPIDTFH